MCEDDQGSRIVNEIQFAAQDHEGQAKGNYRRRTKYHSQQRNSIVKKSIASPTTGEKYKFKLVSSNSHAWCR